MSLLATARAGVGCQGEGERLERTVGPQEAHNG